MKSTRSFSMTNARLEGFDEEEERSLRHNWGSNSKTCNSKTRGREPSSRLSFFGLRRSKSVHEKTGNGSKKKTFKTLPPRKTERFSLSEFEPTKSQSQVSAQIPRPKVKVSSKRYDSIYPWEEAGDVCEHRGEKLALRFDLWEKADEFSVDCQCSSLPKPIVKASCCKNCYAKISSERKLVELVVRNALERVRGLMVPLDSEDYAVAYNKRNELDIFNSKEGYCCPLSLKDFILRLLNYVQIWFHNNAQAVHSHAGIYCLFMSLAYMRRMREFTGVLFCEKNVYNVLLSCFLIAMKTCEDEPISSVWWANVGEVSAAKLNSMELEICKMLEFNLWIEYDELVDCYELYLPRLENILRNVEESLISAKAKKILL